MSKRGELREEYECGMLLPIALEIHGAVCGSGEWYSHIEKHVVLLQSVIEHWEEAHGESKPFDDAVKAVLQAAVNEYHRHIQKALA